MGSRRDFIKAVATASFAGVVGRAGAAAGKAPCKGVPDGSGHELTGRKLPPWKTGELQVHFIYTGVGESLFWIFPDGTTMLLDCGDHPAIRRGKKAVWVLPDGKRDAGEWVARYVQRVNPHGKDVDYMMLSHHHSDHGGMEDWGMGVREWRGGRLSLNGFLLAADTLKFKKCFDRGWPDFNEPIPNECCDTRCYSHIRKVFDHLIERDGLKMKKFDVGAVNQVAMLRNAAAYPQFKITNIAANGKILCRDGSIRDLYVEVHDAKRLNENGMCLGLMVEYGAFRFYTAGDFSDNVRLPDGTIRNIEKEFAKELDPVNVAKVNHHGYKCMPDELVSALRPQVWTTCIWDQLHLTADTLERMSSRKSYPGPRLIAGGVFSPLRRFEDEGNAFLDDIAKESFNAGHVVLSVAPGGGSYKIVYVTADDESMKVTGAYDFVS